MHVNRSGIIILFLDGLWLFYLEDDPARPRGDSHHCRGGKSHPVVELVIAKPGVSGMDGAFAGGSAGTATANSSGSRNGNTEGGRCTAVATALEHRQHGRSCPAPAQQRQAEVTVTTEQRQQWR